MRRIQRLRRQERQNLVVKMFAQPGIGFSIDPLLVSDMNTGAGQHRAQIAPYGLLPLVDLPEPGGNRAKLLSGSASVV